MPGDNPKNPPQTTAGLIDARCWRRGLTLLALATGLLLAGCSDGADPAAQAPTASEPTPQEKIAELETSGQLPQLERLPLLGGMDADGDGVRDDIALHIEKTYTDPVERRAAMQVARAYQNQLLVDINDHVALQAASEQMMRAIACEGTAFTGPSGLRQGQEMAHDIRAMTTNTKERLQAYLAYNKARSGSVSVRVEGSSCE